MWNSGTSSDALTYGYTDNNQLTSVTHSNGSFANETFSWDASGNQAGTGYTTSTGNEQTASPGYTYTYDDDGNMLASTQTSTGDVWTYTYDFRNLMTSAVEKNSSGTILAQATFTYDALGNRIGMNENGVQTWTLYDGSTPVMDFTSSGSLATRYFNGPAGDIVDTVLARELSNGTVAWYLSDHLGTVRDVMNNTGGIIDHVDYSAFGTVLAESSPSNGDRMTGFAGLERDTVTGLNLATFRVQNPATGRWMSQDPLGFAAGDDNLYRYVGDAPVAYNDPPGLQSWIGPGYGALPSGPPARWTYPTAPVGSWSPTDYFGPMSPLIPATAWGCGALAAWQAGAKPNAGGMYHPGQVFKIPGVKYYLTDPYSQESIDKAWEEAWARRNRQGGGVIIVVQHPDPNWTPSWEGGSPWGGGSNYATCTGAGPYYEYATGGDSDPRGPRFPNGNPRFIILSPVLPSIPVRAIVVVPPQGPSKL